MAKAKTRVSSVIEKLKDGGSSFQSFSTPNGLNLQVMVVGGQLTTDDLILNGERIAPQYVLQAAEILKLVAPGASKVCVFHGLLSGTQFGCQKCRASVMTEVRTAQLEGTVVNEEEA